MTTPFRTTARAASVVTLAAATMLVGGLASAHIPGANNDGVVVITDSKPRAGHRRGQSTERRSGHRHDHQHRRPPTPMRHPRPERSGIPRPGHRSEGSRACDGLLPRQHLRTRRIRNPRSAAVY